MKNMTVTEALNYLNGKRVFVGAYSAEIQTVAMAAGYLWGKDPMDVVKHLTNAYLFFTIKDNGAWIKTTDSLDKFNSSSKTLVTAEDITSIRFKDNGHYVTAETYLKRHADEFELAMAKRSISEAKREGRAIDPAMQAIVDKYEPQPVAAPAATVSVTVEVNTYTLDDVRRAYTLGYTQGWDDKTTGKAFNAVCE